MCDKELETQKNVSPPTDFIKKVKHELCQRTTVMDETHSTFITFWELCKLELKICRLGQGRTSE